VQKLNETVSLGQALRTCCALAKRKEETANHNSAVYVLNCLLTAESIGLFA